jgi:hypothetical protein
LRAPQSSPKPSAPRRWTARPRLLRPSPTMASAGEPGSAWRLSSVMVGPFRLHRRPATHVPEHAPREPTPRQEPLPELVDKRPLPLAYEPPEETLTRTAPLLDTLPLAGPDTTPSWISTPKLELESQAPRRVMICTVQLPSKREAACAVSHATVVAIAPAIAAIESKIVFIAATLR